MIEETMVGDALVGNAVSEFVMTWQRRLSHSKEVGTKSIFLCNLLFALKCNDLDFLKIVSIYGRHHKASFPSFSFKSSNVLELTNSDTWEALVEYLGGLSYFISFIDGYSRRFSVYMLKGRTALFIILKTSRLQLKTKGKEVSNVFKLIRQLDILLLSLKSLLRAWYL